MKRWICSIFALAMALGLGITVFAAEVTPCTISADCVYAAPGKQVTVPIQISGNAGFTNFAIALDYDEDQLTLISLDTTDAENAYLCGETASCNTAWTDGTGNFCGYVVSASSEAIKEDGILFTATFEVSENFSGAAEVTPVVQYMRNDRAMLPIFEERKAIAKAGTITGILPGDFDGDGIVTVRDISNIMKAYRDKRELDDERMLIMDIDGDGLFTIRDISKLFLIYQNKE